MLSLAGAYAAFDRKTKKAPDNDGDLRQLICARWPATEEYMYLCNNRYDYQFLSLSLPRTAMQLGGKKEYMTLTASNDHGRRKLKSGAFY